VSNTLTLDPLPLPSERKFGLLFAGIGLALSAWGYVQGWSFGMQIALAAVGGVFLLLAWLAPSVLRPLNKLWFAFGLLLGKVISPLVLGVMFFLLVTPFAVVGRMMGRDELRLKKRHVDSYWVDRQSGTPASESFKNQF
jgi:hypothetical protein